jgi:hypothetical protein
MGSLFDGNGSYVNNLNCEWKIAPIGARSVKLTFTALQTEAGFDFVRVFSCASADCLSKTELPGSPFSGKSLPGPVVSPTGVMLVDFDTDATVVDAGFEANFTQICPAGSYCMGNATNVTACATSYYCPAGSTSQTKCPASSYCTAPSTIAVCTLSNYCPVGSISQNKCKAGFYCPSTKSIGTCTLSNYCPAGSTSQAKCPCGSFCNTTASLFGCPAGFYCPLGSVNATPCGTGSFCPTNRTCTPTPCPIGTFSDQIAQTVCKACKDSPASHPAYSSHLRVSG